jgi:hypothetical protein
MLAKILTRTQQNCLHRLIRGDIHYVYHEANTTDPDATRLTDKY